MPPPTCISTNSTGPNSPREFPELEADRVPTVEELRSRFDMIAGGML